ncbi:MAG: autotransporter-associated beta strand repeat-containing protein, partial [Bacteroidota bacterium]
MKTAILVLMVLAVFWSNISKAANRYSITTGPWNSTNTWSTSPGGSSGASVPVSTDDVFITGGWTVTLDVSTAVTLNSISISAGSSLTTTSAFNVTATTITVNGNYNNGSTGSITFTTLYINSGGTYSHNINGGTIPTATWDPASNCIVTGMVASAVSGLNQSFGNFKWNCTGQTAVQAFPNTGTISIAGNLDINATNTGQLQQAQASLSVVNFSQTAGTYRICSGSSQSLSLTGNFSISGGTLLMSDAAGTGSLNVGGNFGATAGTINESGAGSGAIIFNKSGVQTYTSGVTITNTINFTVNSGSTLQMAAATTLVTGGGGFTLASGATLGVTSANGILATTASGNIQVTGTRTFSAGANYIYNGGVTQATGTGLTQNQPANVTINDAGFVVTLSAITTISGSLNIMAGTLNIAALTLTVGDLRGSGNITKATGGTTITVTCGSDNANTTYSGVISNASGTIALTKVGTGTLVLSGNSSYSGVTTISAGVIQLGSAGSGLNTPLGVIAGGTTITAGAALDLNGFTLATAEGLTIKGSGISYGGALTNTSLTAVTYSGLVVVGAPASIITNAGDINLSNAGSISGTFELTIGGSGNGSISSILALSTAALTKTDAGTWTLLGANTYTGATTISGGTLKLGAANRISNSSALVVNGTFDMAGFSETMGSITGSGTITSSVAGTITFGTSGTTNTSFSGIIQNGSATLGLTKTGAGIQTLSTPNTYTGGTIITAGTLLLSDAGALGAAGANVSMNGGTLHLMTDSPVNVYNVTVTATASTISSDRTTSGAGITHILGTLSIGNFTLNFTAGANVTSGTAGLTFGNTTLSAATPIFSTGVTTNVTLGAITGNFSFTKSGSGQLTLNTASTRSTGVTTLSAGTLSLGASNALGTTGTTLTLTTGILDLMIDNSVNAYNTTVNGAVTITSDRATSGSGITHALGTLSIGNFVFSSNLGSNVNNGSGGITFGNTAFSASTPIFDIGSGVNMTLGVISGNQSFTKQNAGQLTLNSASSRSSGTATLTAGTLALGSATALGTTATLLALNGGTLDLNIDASISAYNTTVGGTVTISSDRASSGSGITHVLGTLSIGNYTLNLSPGSNVANGTAGLTFGATTLSASTPVFDIGSNANLTLGAISGNFDFIKQDAGSLILNSASSRSAGASTLNAGTMILGSTTSLGTTGTTLVLNAGILDLMTDVTMSAYNTSIGGNVTISSDRATTGTGITHTLGTLSIGNNSLYLTVGTNISGGTAGITFGSTTFTASTPVFDVATGGLLTLGALTGNFDFTKQNNGQLTMNTAAASRTAGLSTLNGGTLALGNVSALGTTGTSLALNGGTLDLMTDGTVNAYNTSVGGNVIVLSDRATSGAGITHALGNLDIGAYTLTINKGTNVASGTAVASFGNLTSSGAPIFNTGTANLYFTGSATGAFKITKSGVGTLQKTSAGWTLPGDFEITAGTYNANSLTTGITGLTTLSGGTYTAGSATQTLSGGLTISGGTYTGAAGALTTADVILNSGTLTAPSTTTTVSGNWTNNGGAFTAGTGLVSFNNTLIDQNIDGTAVTQTFNSLTVAKSLNKLILGGSTTTLIVSGTLTMTSGLIDCSGKTLQSGTSTSIPGTITYTAGSVIGTLKRYFNATGAKQFPLGNSSSSGTSSTPNRNVLLTFTNLTNGSITAGFVASDPGNTGLSLTENSLSIDNQFTEGYWSLVGADGLASTNYALELTGSGFSSQSWDAEVRILKRPSGGGSWTLNGTHVATVSNTAKRSALSGFSEFALAKASSCPTITGVTNGNRCGTGTVALGATASGSGPINWYAAPSGGASLGSGTSFTTPSISQTTSYFAGCASGTRTIATASVFNVPDYTATTTDASCPASNNGAITVNTLPSALSFVTADNDSISLGATYLNNLSAFTLEGWIKIGSTASFARTSLFGQNDAIEFGFISSTNIECYTAGGGSLDVATTLYPGDNSWHHIAAVGNGTNILIYIDGIQRGSGGTATANYGTSIYKTKIGAGIYDAIGGGFTGQIIKVGFWNIALTPSQILSLAAGFTTYTEGTSGLLAGFNFFEGSGTTLTKVGSVANNGTFYNTPVWTDPFTYAWTKTGDGSFVPTTKDISTLTLGQYNLTTYLGSCTKAYSWDINAAYSAPTAPTLGSASPASGTTICAGFNSGTVTGTGGSGGAPGSANEYQISFNGGSSYTSYTSGAAINTNTASGNVIVQGRRTGGTTACSATSWNTLCTWTLGSATVNPVLNAATPASGTSICAGYSPSATITAGSGGSSGAADLYEYS